MRSVTIARNYAEALFELGDKSGKAAAYAELIDAVAGALAAAPSVQAVLMSPRITKTAKARLFSAALPDAPAEFVKFLQAVVKRGRQALLSEIASEYLVLLDTRLNRVRASVTLAHPADPALQQQIAERLSAVVGKQVIPHFHEDPSILGGVVMKVGDRVFDGSVRRRIATLRRSLLPR